MSSIASAVVCDDDAHGYGSGSGAFRCTLVTTKQMRTYLRSETETWACELWPKRAGVSRKTSSPMPIYYNRSYTPTSGGTFTISHGVVPMVQIKIDVVDRDRKSKREEFQLFSATRRSYEDVHRRRLVYADLWSCCTSEQTVSSATDEKYRIPALYIATTKAMQIRLSSRF